MHFLKIVEIAPYIFTPLDIRWGGPLISPASHTTRMSGGGVSALWTRECMYPLEHFSLPCVCLHH